MAIKISNNTIIDDNRVVVNASKVGVGTTNPTSELTVGGNVLVNDWDFSSISLVGIATISPNNTIQQSRGVAVSQDGRYLYLGDTGESIFQIPESNVGLSTNEGLTQTENLDTFDDEDHNIESIRFTFDLEGKYVYVTNSLVPKSIHQFPLGEPWDISTIGAQVGITSMEPVISDGSFQDIKIKSDGTAVYLAVNSGISSVYQVNLNTPWTISDGYSSFTLTDAFNNLGIGDIEALEFTSDGTHWISVDSTANLQIFKMQIPWDITTSEYVGETVLPGVSTTYQGQAMAMNDSGSLLYVVSREENGSSTEPEKIYKFSINNNSNNKTEIVGQADIYGTLNSHQNLNSYGTFESTGQTLVNSINNGPLAGFRNAIINGNFDVWQRGTSFTGVGNQYDRTADLWRVGTSSGTGKVGSVTRQTHTPGQTNVPGEPRYYARVDITTAGSGYTDFTYFWNNMESVRTFAGKQVTFSLWARSVSSTFDFSVDLYQNFGTGGSPSSAVNHTSETFTTTTQFKKYTYTTTLSSLKDKTLGTNDNDYLRASFLLPANSVFTFDISRVQLELGAIATPFEYRPIQVELDLCRRYYQKGYPDEGGSVAIKSSGSTTNNFNSTHHFSPSMYSQPTITIVGTPTYASGTSNLTVTGITTNSFTTTVNVTDIGDPYRAYNWSWTADVQFE